MANMLDYLNWRGDLTLDKDPFNEVDNLILAVLSYVDFRGIVPTVEEGGSVPLYAAAETFFAQVPAGRKLDMGVLVPDDIPELLWRMADTPRFQEMRLSCLADALDVEKGEQFAALTVETGDGKLYLSFRGTDDTIAGWKEDFEMACLREIPAQRKAAPYVQAVARRYPRGKLRLGGHSKGGNLAVYGAANAPALLQRRIESIWSNDGPGFYADFLRQPSYVRIQDRIHSIVPKSSVVGMLLEHTEDYTVVDSDQLGLMQHNGFSWQVLGNRFVQLRQMSPQASQAGEALREWVRALTAEQREQFVDGLLRILSASGAETLTDLREDSLKSALAMVRAMKDLNKETREGLLQFVRFLFHSSLRIMLEDIQDDVTRKR